MITPIAFRPCLFSSLRASAIVAVVALTGCAGNDGVTDDLRKRNDELQREVDKVTRQLRLRESELATLRGEGSELVIGADIPIVTKIEFGRFSGGIDTNRDDNEDTLRVYLLTQDQRNRFIVVAGEVTLQAVLIKAGAPPIAVIEKKFTPAEVEKAYRSGITGTHYTFDAPIPKTADDIRTLTVKATFTDATTGKVLSVEKPMKIKTKL